MNKEEFEKAKELDAQIKELDEQLEWLERVRPGENKIANLYPRLKLEIYAPRGASRNMPPPIPEANIAVPMDMMAPEEVVLMMIGYKKKKRDELQMSLNELIREDT